MTATMTPGPLRRCRWPGLPLWERSTVIVMGRNSISGCHDNGSLVWTWRLSLAVGGAGLLLEAVTAVL
jgi:hypothetical protein